MELSQEYLQEILDYDPETGLTFWKTRPRTDFRYAREHKAWNKRLSYQQLTDLNPSTGKIICVIHRTYSLDQLLWKLINNQEARTIYHLNGCNADNTLTNLSTTPGNKATKYTGGDLYLTMNEFSIFVIGSGRDLEPPVKVTPRNHLLNFYKEIREARTALMELAERFQVGWNNLLEEE